MKTATAGRFTIEVGGPYPCWVRICLDDQELHGIHHNELSDLEYCVKKAMQEARLLLKKDREEV